MFLEGVLAHVGGGADGGDGGFVDDCAAGLVFGCHDCFVACLGVVYLYVLNPCGFWEGVW